MFSPQCSDLSAYYSEAQENTVPNHQTISPRGAPSTPSPPGRHHSHILNPTNGFILSPRPSTKKISIFTKCKTKAFNRFINRFLLSFRKKKAPTIDEFSFVNDKNPFSPGIPRTPFPSPLSYQSYSSAMSSPKVSPSLQASSSPYKTSPATSSPQASSSPFKKSQHTSHSKQHVSFSQHVLVHTPGTPTTIDVLKQCLWEAIDGTSKAVDASAGAVQKKGGIFSSKIGFIPTWAVRNKYASGFSMIVKKEVAKKQSSSSAARSLNFDDDASQIAGSSNNSNSNTKVDQVDSLFMDDNRIILVRPPSPMRHLPAINRNGGPVRPMPCLLRRVNPITLTPLKNVVEIDAAVDKKTKKGNDGSKRMRGLRRVMGTLKMYITMKKESKKGFVDFSDAMNGGESSLGRTRSMIAASLPPAILVYSDDVLRQLIENLYTAEQRRCMKKMSQC